MWCTFCDMVVQHKEKTYAALHVKGGKHKKNVEKKPFLVDKPGPTAEVKQEAVPPVEDQGDSPGRSNMEKRSVVTAAPRWLRRRLEVT